MSIRLTTTTTTRTTIGDLVAADFRAAAVFQGFGIDFCCGGRRSFEEACEDAAVDPGEVRREIDALPAAGREGDVTGWPLDRLIDHILEVHHDYVRAALPTIAKYLTKLNEVHGSRHPELATVASHFARMRTELGQHMMKEEQVLFPYIRELLSTGVADRRNASPFGTIENPIRMMQREHREAADELDAIKALTSGYVPPSDGCVTYAVCMAELQRFERDLHRHVHLENNVLFPRAVELESGLQSDIG
jgi:regulator of cell morphogenesis and NO signaling